MIGQIVLVPFPGLRSRFLAECSVYNVHMVYMNFGSIFRCLSLVYLGVLYDFITVVKSGPNIWGVEHAARYTFLDV